MTRLKLLTATAVLATVVASPVMAQQMAQEPVARHHNDRAYNRGYDHRDSGFWPGDVAAGVVGGAIGAADAIATAPFRGDSYAYYNGGFDGGPDANLHG